MPPTAPQTAFAEAKARLQHVLGVTKDSLEREAADLGEVLDRLKFAGSTPAELDAILAETRSVLARAGVPTSGIGYHHLADAYAGLAVAREKLASAS